MSDLNYFEMWQCDNATCRFRFPVVVGSGLGEICPHCGEAAAAASPSFTNQISPVFASPPTTSLAVLVDNVRSIYNVGSFFRTADGVGGITHFYFCGITPTPDNPKVAKTALGAEKSVSWSYHRNGWETAVSLQEQGYELWALEVTAVAESLLTATLVSSPTVLIVGNELSGIDPAILESCDKVVAIPMQGYKGSLNVASAFAIAVYWLRYGR